jgi:CheY-like chemotaxis protein
MTHQSPAVLLNVDDNDVARYARGRLLRHAGFSVRDAASGSSALEAMAERPDLVVLDVGLPDMSGFDVCRRIKSDRALAAIPVLQVSATFVKGTDRVRALDGGADGYLIEPIEPEVLVATVNAMLRARRAEIELAAERQAWDRSNRLKEEFLGRLSDELRAPLLSVQAWTRLLRAANMSAETFQRAVDAIERSATTQARLLSDLLDISRIAAGQLPLEMRSVELGAIVQSAVDAVREEAASRGVTLARSLDAAGPIQGDADRLRQAVESVLHNAVKASPAGGRIDIWLRRDGAYVELGIRDEGPGIPNEILPHLFEPFHELRSRPTRDGGLGLGLPIAQHVTRRHGGEMVARSGESGGACFILRFPSAEPAAAPADSAHARPSPPEELVLKGVRVLTVEDSADSRELLVTVLEMHGADVRAAASAAQALAILDAWRPDVILADIGMPGEDGYHFIERVRARPADRGGRIPAIAWTGYAMSDDRLRTLRAGYQIHVTKPASPQELVSAIVSLVRPA